MADRRRVRCFLAAAVYLGLTAISLLTAVTAAIIGDTTVTPLQVAAAKRIKFWVRTRNDPYRLHVDCLTGHSKVQRLDWRAAGRLTPQARQVVDTLIRDRCDGSVGALVDAARVLAS